MCGKRFCNDTLIAVLRRPHKPRWSASSDAVTSEAARSRHFKKRSNNESLQESNSLSDDLIRRLTSRASTKANEIKLQVVNFFLRHQAMRQIMPRHAKADDDGSGTTV